MKIWIIKHALTQGISEVEAEPHPRSGKIMVVHNPEDDKVSYYNAGGYRKTWEEAVAAVEKKKATQIAIYKKWIAKLKELKFTEP